MPKAIPRTLGWRWTGFRWGALAAIAAFCAAWSPPSALAQTAGFKPDLGLAPELIDGGKIEEPAIPAGSAELMAHPMAAEPSQTLLTEVPDKPFRKIDESARAHRWWKFPIYAVVGFPRDLVDSFFATLRFIPIISVADYVAYEKVPTQFLMRDPRDWHNWTGAQNKNGHGFYDGNAWGYFPSLNNWSFAYVSGPQAKADEAYNTQLRGELDLANRSIEQHNQTIAARKLEARSEALKAIQNGDGGEAVRRMIPYFRAYPLDTTGAFALLATGLAMYAPDGPAWTAPMLWKRLNDATPGPLAETEELMKSRIDRAPEGPQGDEPVLNEALIYVQLLLHKGPAAETSAQHYLARRPDDLRRKRLALESELTARDAPAADAAFASIDAAQLPAWERQVLLARIELLKGDIEPARQTLSQLRNATPENPYLNYYLGVAELLKAQSGIPQAEDFQAAFTHLETAALQATHPALRQRAGEALAYVRSVLPTFEAQPELFPATPEGARVLNPPRAAPAPAPAPAPAQ